MSNDRPDCTSGAVYNYLRPADRVSGGALTPDEIEALLVEHEGGVPCA